MLPTAHYKDGGVRIASFRSWIPTSPSPCLRFAESLAVSAQDSGPSRSLVFTRKALSSSASCRFIPAHCNRDFSPIELQARSSGLPTTRPECELGLSCMYFSPSAHFSALHTFQTSTVRAVLARGEGLNVV